MISPNKMLFLIVTLTSLNLNAQLIKIEIDIKGNFTPIIELKDAGIELSYRGKLVDFDTTGQIQYDFSGNPISIASTQITYDSGRVNSIGSKSITYDWPGRVLSGGNYISSEGIVFKFKCSK